MKHVFMIMSCVLVSFVGIVVAYEPSSADEALLALIEVKIDELSLTEAANISQLLEGAKMKFEEGTKKYRYVNHILSYMYGGILATPEEVVEPMIYVQEGDHIGVFYIGTLEDGRLFDTNVIELAKEAGVYQSGRPYSPLEFTVGAGEMIAGFDTGVIDMYVGETKILSIPPEEAYGFGNHPLAGETLIFEVTVEVIIE